VIKLGLVAMPAMLFIFLVKPLLKVKRLDRTALFEVDPKRSPTSSPSSRSSARRRARRSRCASTSRTR